MSITRMPINQFMNEVRAAYSRKDGYIMGATGQDPKKWSTGSWWFTQYSGSQKTKALYWREHAARVWDCNGLAEGIYKDFSGVDINTKARYNYSGWCSPKGTGLIPASQRREGAAVFWGNTAATITHVAYLDAPVESNNPTGDWWIIEARGVMYGVVRTKLSSRKPNFWGLMTKYFDYSDTEIDYVEPSLGERILKKGMEGSDVKTMQENLITLGYDCGKWGADGEFGSDTEAALKAFQEAKSLEVDGEYGPLSHAAMLAALDALQPPVQVPVPEIPAEQTPDQTVEVPTGNLMVATGSWNVRTGPGTDYAIAAVVHGGDRLLQAENDGWTPIVYNNEVRWISNKALDKS